MSIVYLSISIVTMHIVAIIYSELGLEIVKNFMQKF